MYQTIKDESIRAVAGRVVGLTNAIGWDKASNATLSAANTVANSPGPFDILTFTTDKMEAWMTGARPAFLKPANGNGHHGTAANDNYGSINGEESHGVHADEHGDAHVA